MSIVVRWLWRKRLRLTGYGLTGCESPVNLHNQQMLFSEHQFWESDGEHRGLECGRTKDRPADDAEPCVLPVLALNEVYIGETLSSRYQQSFIMPSTQHNVATDVKFLSSLRMRC